MKRRSGIVAVVVGSLLGLLGWQPAKAQQAPPPKTSLARYLPANGLVAYLEFQGLKAHQAAWSKTALHRVLTETSTGAMLEAMASKLYEKPRTAPPEESSRRPSGKDMVSLLRKTLDEGFAASVYRSPEGNPSLTIAFVGRGLNGSDVRKAIGPMIASTFGEESSRKILGKPGGRRVSVPADSSGSESNAWWFENDDLCVVMGASGGVESMIAAIDGKAPSAESLPVLADLRKAENGFQPVGIALVDPQILPMTPDQAARLGLDGITRLDYRWGFQDEALMTITRLIAPAPRRGLLALLDHPTFGAKDLPPLPPESTGFLVLSLDLDHFYEQFVAIAELGSPNARRSAEMTEQSFENTTGVGLRKDLLQQIGPKFIVHSIPSRGILPTNPLMGFASGLIHAPKAALLIDVRDPKAVSATLDTLTTRANAIIQQVRDQTRGFEPPVSNFTPLRAPSHGYTTTIQPGVLPVSVGLHPTFLVGKSHLIVGSTPVAALHAENQTTKPASRENPALKAAMRHLPDRMMMLILSDTRETMLPDLVANLPGLVSMIGSPGGFASMITGRQMPGPRFNFLGNPTQGGFALKVDPSLTPDPDAIRALLFPASYTMTATDQGFTFTSRESVPGLNPTTTGPLAAALFLPALTTAREAAKRSQSVNNLKQIGLAMHNYYSVNDHLPGTIRDADGKALLSWRVNLLPYLEEQALYNEFHLDEPWDSPHNKPLMARMPKAFAVPGAKAPQGFTFYRSFSGQGAIFDNEGNDGLGFQNITDGLSNTIAVIEASEAVEWTRPENDIPFKPADEGADKALLGSVGSHFPGGFNALLLDGSVKFIKKSVNIGVLKALITYNGGEIIPGDTY